LEKPRLSYQNFDPQLFDEIDEFKNGSNYEKNCCQCHQQYPILEMCFSDIKNFLDLLMNASKQNPTILSNIFEFILEDMVMYQPQ